MRCKATSTAVRVFVVGPVPPPVHGASVITQKVAVLLRNAGADVVECNTSPRADMRGPRWHLSRAVAWCRCYWTILSSCRSRTVYVSLSGGLGLVYDLALILIAKIKGHGVVLHHHSFTYIDRWQPVLWILLKIAPVKQVHVVLGAEMGRKLLQRYGVPSAQILHVSNLCFFPELAPAAVDRRELRRIGSLSNISAEKGIDRFLDLAGHFAAVPGIEAHIAGPFVDSAIEGEVKTRIRSLPNVTYHGPVFGERKREFYENIDVFVFLSRYPNEAEPLVLYEAMLAGLPMAVTARGCICDMVDSDMAIVVDPVGRDIEAAAEKIREWIRDPDSYRCASAAAGTRIGMLLSRRKAQRLALMAAFGLRTGAESEQFS